MDPNTIGSHGSLSGNLSDPNSATTSNDIKVEYVAENNEMIHDYGADTDLKRILGTRHLTMVAVASSIGMGLWLGSGTSLIKGGPAGIFLGYLLSGTICWAVVHSVGEMSIIYPLPSAFVQWTGKFVSPAAAFTLGWAYWFNYVIAVAIEVQGLVTVLSFWTDAVPKAAMITLFSVGIAVCNIFAVSVWGEIEVISSTIKFGWIFVVTISLIVFSAGGGPNHEAIGFRYWNSEPFTNGFKGFISVMPTCIFAMGGAENCGLVACETKSPKKSMPHAVGSVWVRLSLFYLLGALMVSINVSPHDPSLFGASGTNASPFVLAYRNAGVEPMAHMMNAVIFISVLSTGSVTGYSGSRIMMGLGYLGMAPKITQRADKIGRPWAGLLSTLILGGGLAYLSLNHASAQVFTWLSNLTSLCTLFGWANICFAHIRFRRAWALQGRDPSELPWESWTYPWAAYWGLSWCVILFIVEFYLAVSPLQGKPSASNFFANYLSAVAFVFMFLGAQLYYRGPWWVKLDDVDLDFGRRFYIEEDVEKVATGMKAKSLKFLGGLFK